MNEPVQETAMSNDVGHSTVTSAESDGVLSIRTLPSILPDGFTVDGLTLHVSDDVTEENFAAACRIVSDLANFSYEGLPYMLGDMINAGERLYPEKYAQWLDLSPYTLGTMRNYAWMCSRVPPENRRIVGIQQTMVAARFKDVKEQRRFLDRSAKEGLTAREFGRLARGEEHYKRKALPETRRRDVVTLRQQMEAAFDRVWNAHRATWQFFQPQDLGRAVWIECVNLSMELR